MNSLYGRPVFNEWAVIAAAGVSGHVLAYEGPRRDVFARELPRDLGPLRAELEAQPREPGVFGFAREAGGTRYDAYIVLGPSVYLLCNHTEQTINEITDDVRWRKAQAPFASLAEAFRLDPLRIQPAASAATR